MFRKNPLSEKAAYYLKIRIAMHDLKSLPLSILAGGEGRRLGGVDKCLLEVHGKTILQHLIDNFSPVTSPIFLNANGDPSRFQDYDIAVIQDHSSRLVGPLGGVLASLNHINNSSDCEKWLMTVSGDSPFLPGSIAEAFLKETSNEKDVIYCRCAGRDHFVIGLWSVRVVEKLKSFLDSGGRSVGEFISSCRYQTVDFPDEWESCFFNINTDAGLREANRKHND